MSYRADVPSAAFLRWDTAGQQALDEIEAAHRAIGGAGRGRRFATLRVNHAYAMLLSSQFQGFCRDLHSEAVQVIVATLPLALQDVVTGGLVNARRLDHGNPNPGNLGEDFGRFGTRFWPAVNALDRRNAQRQAALEELNKWRNAIAHQDWSKVGPHLRIGQVRAWRSACRALSSAFDRVVGAQLATLGGAAPW